MSCVRAPALRVSVPLLRWHYFVKNIIYFRNRNGVRLFSKIYRHLGTCNHIPLNHFHVRLLTLQEEQQINNVWTLPSVDFCILFIAEENLSSFLSACVKAVLLKLGL